MQQLNRSIFFDPPEEVCFDNVEESFSMICAIVDPHLEGSWQKHLLRQALQDTISAYQGHYLDYLKSDTLYHDLRHALETALVTARILDGYCLSAIQKVQSLDSSHVLLAVILALFHDIGLLRSRKEDWAWGPSFTPVHEKRSVTFAKKYLASTQLSSFSDQCDYILLTNLAFHVPDHWKARGRIISAVIATADLYAQMADRCYLEKCHSFLFLELSACGLAGVPGSRYPTPEILLKKTSHFFSELVWPRLNEDYMYVGQYLKHHFGGENFYESYIGKNLAYLKRVVEECNMSLLKRRVVAFHG